MVDPEQLQAIEAGAAFRALADRHGAVEITQVRRQWEDWQRQATWELATGRTAAALERYEQAGIVLGHDTTEAAREVVVEGWARALGRERAKGVTLDYAGGFTAQKDFGGQPIEEAETGIWKGSSKMEVLGAALVAARQGQHLLDGGDHDLRPVQLDGVSGVGDGAD